MSMVEVVARALAAQSWDAGGNDAHREAFIDRRWTFYIPQARAAIEAMMEPTDEMVAVGGFEALEASMAERRHYAEIKARLGGLPAYESQVQRHAWKAMITAALKEG